MKTEIYVHADRLSVYEKGVRLNLGGDALGLFQYTGSEVKLDLEVNEEGEAKIIAVDDEMLVCTLIDRLKRLRFDDFNCVTLTIMPDDTIRVQLDSVSAMILVEKEINMNIAMRKAEEMARDISICFFCGGPVGSCKGKCED